MARALVRSFFSIALAWSCGTPAIDEFEPHSGVIEGTLLFHSMDGDSTPCAPAPVRGNTIVFLFRADDPPPPEGTGNPINFVVVPERELFGEPSGRYQGILAAPFTIPTVPAGIYRIRAFIDADRDFTPNAALLSQPTAGDVGGGHVDPDTGAFRDIVVENDRITSHVDVSLGRRIPVERPAFAVTSTPTWSVPMRAPGTLVLSAHAVMGSHVTMTPECTRFLVAYVDGVAKDRDGDHLSDLYPRVVLRRRVDTEAETTVLVPTVVNPFPFEDALRASPEGVTTELLELIVLSFAIERSDAGDRRLAEIPSGQYETIVLSGTGQTWQVPNDRNRLEASSAPDPTQDVSLELVAGMARPAGSIRGTVRIAPSKVADTYVVALSAKNPPPPRGSGRPVALAAIAKDEFRATTSTLAEASFVLDGLEDGDYLVGGIVDLDGNMSPLVDLVAQPSARDVGTARVPMRVEHSRASGDVALVATREFSSDRPVFEFEADLALDRRNLPRRIELRTHAIDALDITSESAAIPVMLAGGDDDDDNLPDLYPRVVLAALAEADDPRGATDDSNRPNVIAMVDPIAHLGLLASGASFVRATTLDVLVLPYAVLFGSDGSREIRSVEAGDYRVYLLSGTGQTWSVPSSLDLDLARIGTPLEDPTQRNFLRIEGEIPRGTLSGIVELPSTPPTGDFRVVIGAFDAHERADLLGSQPKSSTIVPKNAFGGLSSSTYSLSGLETGTYQVRAFLDANDDFTAWFSTMNQPNAGDVAGGHIDGTTARFLEVDVDALGGGVSDIDVVLSDAMTFATDRPALSLSPDPAVFARSSGRTTLTLRALRAATDLLRVDGIFPVQWVDLDRDGTADDVDGDGSADVFPLVIAELLDSADPSGATLASPNIRMFGRVDPTSVAGFPADDLENTSIVIPVVELRVVFHAVAISSATPTTPIEPPTGDYRITLVNAYGQTWTIPNELARARGTSLSTTQGARLEVVP